MTASFGRTGHATNPITTPPENSADTEARKILRVDARTSVPDPHTTGNGSVGASIAGSQVAGQTRVGGGSA